MGIAYTLALALALLGLKQCGGETWARGEENCFEERVEMDGVPPIETLRWCWKSTTCGPTHDVQVLRDGKSLGGIEYSE